MANLETNDFSESFDKDFYNDLSYIADQVNLKLEDLDQDHGGQLEELNRNFSPHRNNFLDLLENIISNEVLRNRRSLDDILTDAILASAAVCAGTIRRTTRESQDWVRGETENNPFLAEISRNSRDRRDSGRRTERTSSRYSRTERNPVDYHRRRDSGRTEARPARDSSRRTTRRTSAPVEVPRGRIAAVTQPKREEVQETHQQRSSPPPVVQQVKTGEVILSTNLEQTGVSYGLLYVAGDEQVVYSGSGLEVAEFTGESEVDYNAHRIDLFFPDILGDGNKTELTAIAIREAEKAKDQTIQRYIMDPNAEEGAELLADPKLFKYASSGSYKEELRFPTRAFHPVEVRDTLVEEHTGDINWFAKHALFVKVEQAIGLSDMSNDNVLRLKGMINCEKVLDTVAALIELSDKLDPVVWRLLHDYITVGFNKRLVSLDLNILVGSITADWEEFRVWLQANRPELAETLNIKNGIMNGLSVETVENVNNLIIRRDTLFLPINSYDLDFASATASQGFAVLTDQSKIFKFVNDLMSGGITVLYLTTLDGQSLAVRDISGVMGSRYFVTKE